MAHARRERLRRPPSGYFVPDARDDAVLVVLSLDPNDSPRGCRLFQSPGCWNGRLQHRVVVRLPNRVVLGCCRPACVSIEHTVRSRSTMVLLQDGIRLRLPLAVVIHEELLRESLPVVGAGGDLGEHGVLCGVAHARHKRLWRLAAVLSVHTHGPNDRPLLGHGRIIPQPPDGAAHPRGHSAREPGGEEQEGRPSRHAFGAAGGRSARGGQLASLGPE